MNYFSLGFNGERIDPISLTTHLGNGYRSYNPSLIRFNSPDSMSPFDAGEVNQYAYCAGDPINRADPSGHFSIGGALGIGLGILGILLTPVTAGTSLAAIISVCSVTAGIASVGLGIASELVHDQKLASILGWTGMALGLTSGIGAGIMSKLAPNARSLAGLLVSQGRKYVVITEDIEMNSLARARASRAKAYIADPANFEHQVNYQGQQGLVNSRHLDTEPGAVSSFRNRYQPDVWELIANNRDPRIKQFYTSDVIEYQYSLASGSGGFENKMPSRIILKDVVSEGLRNTKEGTYSPQSFLRGSGIGRSLGRFAQAHQMSLTHVEVIRELQYGGYRDLNFHLHFSSFRENFRILAE